MSVLPSALQPIAPSPFSRYPRFVDASNSRKERDGSTHRGHPRNRRCPERHSRSFSQQDEHRGALQLIARRKTCERAGPFFCEGPFFVRAAVPRLSRDEESIGVHFSFFSRFFFFLLGADMWKFKTADDRNSTNAIIVCAVKRRQRKKRERGQSESRLVGCLTSKGSFVA